MVRMRSRVQAPIVAPFKIIETRIHNVCEFFVYYFSLVNHGSYLFARSLGFRATNPLAQRIIILTERILTKT